MSVTSPKTLVTERRAGALTLAATPFMARWADAGHVPTGSTKIGNDDTGTYNSSTEEHDT